MSTEHTPTETAESESQPPAPADAGTVGVLVVARCVGCKTTRRKRAPAEAIDDQTSFKHVCHSKPCRRVTWWNVVHIPAEVGP